MKLNQFILFFSVISATQRALEQEDCEYDFELKELSLGLTTTALNSSDTKLVSRSSAKPTTAHPPSDPRRRKKSKKSCPDINLSNISLCTATVIDRNQDISARGIFFRIALRKAFKIYAAVILSLIVAWLHPWLWGHANPYLFALFVEFVIAMLRRTPGEVAFCDSSPISLLLVSLMKAETLIFHSILSIGIVNNLGLRSWHVALLFLCDIYLGMKLNTVISNLTEERKTKDADGK